MFDSLKFPGLNFASQPAAAAGGGGSGTPSTTPTTPPPVAPPTPEAPSAAPPAPAESANMKQLREAYEGLKQKYEPWSKLSDQFKPEQVSQFSGVYEKVHQEALALGRNLGYPDSEIADALHEDPVKTLDFLRDESYRAEQGQPSRAGQGEELQTLIEQGIERAIGPIQERENVRMTNEANQVFERVTHSLIAEDFRKEGIDIGQVPNDITEMLMTATSEILKYDDAAIKALKWEGKTVGIQKAYQEARTLLDKYYLARAGMERGRIGGRPPGAAPVPPGAPPGTSGRKPTLEEMIEDPGRINPKYAERV